MSEYFSYLINFDKYCHQGKYRNPNKMTIQHAHRCIVMGPSGTGKTNVLLNILLTEKTKMDYEKVLLVAKNTTEPKYEMLIKKFRKIEAKLSKLAKTDIQILYVYNKLEDVPSLESLNPEEQHIVIFDDFIAEKDQSVVVDYFIRSRKFNCTLFYLSQSFFSIPKDIRINADYCILFKVVHAGDLRRIHGDMVRGTDYDTFLQVYERAMKVSPYAFVTIDNVTTDENRRVRIGLL